MECKIVFSVAHFESPGTFCFSKFFQVEILWEDLTSLEVILHLAGIAMKSDIFFVDFSAFYSLFLYTYAID